MTTPGGIGESAGDAYVAFHADTKPMVKDLQEGLAEAEVVAATEGEVIGHTLGEHIGEGVKKEVGSQGPSIAREIEQAVEKEVVRPRPRFSLRGLFGGGGRNRSQVREVAQGIEHTVEDAAESIAQPGGPIELVGKNLGRSLTDGIGAVFNVSGKSPLIALLIPVFAELGVLIGGLIQSLGPLLGLLTTLPSIIGGIGLSIGTLVVAFHGLGSAIQGAFAAKNAKELQEAIKNLTPAAQGFVKQLLPLKDIFATISRAAQEQFFSQVGNGAAVVIKELTPILQQGIPALANSLGGLFRGLAQFFASPSMTTFLTDLIPATQKWLAGFGPALVDLLTGLIDIAHASLPFLNTIGHELNDAFSSLGKWLTKLSQDPDFRKWLNRMVIAFEGFLLVIKGAAKFIGVFIDSLDKAGGNDFLDTLVTQLAILMDFFSSDAGIGALKSLIAILIFLGDAFVGIVLIIGFVLAGLNGLWNLLTMLPDAIGSLGKAIWDFWGNLGEAIQSFFTSIDFQNIWKWLDDHVTEFFNALGGKIQDWTKTAAEWGWNLGKSIVHGIWEGIQGMGKWLYDKVYDWIVANLPGPVKVALNIHSPSQVMSDLGEQAADGFGVGFQSAFKRNADMAADLTNDFTNDIGVDTENRNVAFTRGAIQINFNGQLPTQQQAAQVGAAVGQGINQNLAARNARLAVRTM